jgi:tetratricopeptide (TPR) repeat protein
MQQAHALSTLTTPCYAVHCLPHPTPPHPVRNAVYFSNRSAAYANSSKFDEALQDALAVKKLKPGWVKGHARAAAAYMGLELYSEAKEAYEKAVKLEPDDQVGHGGGGRGMGSGGGAKEQRGVGQGAGGGM